MSACPECLRRPLLLRRLAPNIDRLVSRAAGSRGRDLLALDDEDLIAAVAPGRDPGTVLGRAREEAEGLLGGDRVCRVLCRHADRWPGALADLGPSEPRALFLEGEAALLEPDGGPAVAVVGARRSGSYGRQVAEDLGRDLAAAGVRVVSGMAFGVDTAAHEGALLAGGGTIAVLGAGVDRPYPRSRAKLYRRIADAGLVISELPPESPTFRWMFPARNRLMASLSEMVVVVEAAERSGSLITVEMAADLGRPVGAVPGPVDSWRSAGTNRLLVEGGIPVRGAGDVLDALFGAGAAAERLPDGTGPPLDDLAVKVLEAVGGGAATPDAVVAETRLPAPEVARAAVALEIAGYVSSDQLGRMRATNRRPPPPGVA